MWIPYNALIYIQRKNKQNIYLVFILLILIYIDLVNSVLLN